MNCDIILIYTVRNIYTYLLLVNPIIYLMKIVYDKRKLRSL